MVTRWMTQLRLTAVPAYSDIRRLHKTILLYNQYFDNEFRLYLQYNNVYDSYDKVRADNRPYWIVNRSNLHRKNGDGEI